jgi:hypothetical protein
VLDNVCEEDEGSIQHRVRADWSYVGDLRALRFHEDFKVAGARAVAFARILLGLSVFMCG